MASSKKQPKRKASGDYAEYEKYHPPWAVWNDHIINNAEWKSKMDNISSLSYSAPQPQGADYFFEDPAGIVKLPNDVKIKSWIRPHQFYSSGNLVVEPDSTPIDLLTNNQHLLNIKIMRMIMASITCLEREASHRPFPVEFQSDDFVPTFDTHWKPWYHIYFNTRVGKGNKHILHYNPYGKYLVRIFYQGKWRCMVVDDRLPVSEEGLLLLPVSRPNNLWLPILTKALLRVAALSWQPNNHCVDFSVIHCLTGWIPTIIPTQACTAYQAWCICCHLMGSTEEVVRRPGCCESVDDYQCPVDDLADDISAVESRAIFSVVLYPALSRPRQELAMSVNTLEYMLLISNVRYNNDLPNPLWKEYRWKEWAFNKGIISEITDKPLRNVQIFNPFKISNVTPWNKEDITEEPEYWLDFDIFVKYVRYLEVYYKPSYFKFSLNVWNQSDFLTSPRIADDRVGLSLGRRKESKQEKRTSKSKSKSPKSKINNSEISQSKTSPNVKSKSPENLVNRIPPVDMPSNLQEQPFFYLLIDSMACKQLCICLNAYGSVRPTYSHLVVGKFEWHSPSVSPLVCMLSTSATKGYMLSLTPGLHVFRIWYKFPEYFCCQIFCNTPFSTGLKMYIQKALTNESASFTYYGDKMNSCFEQLLNTPEGGAEHGRAYKEFIGSLLPPQLTRQLPWPKWFTAYTEITQAFEDSLSEMLADFTKTAQEVYLALNAYKKLFLNPSFGNETLKRYRNEYYKYIEERRLSAMNKEILLEEVLKDKMAKTRKSKSKDKKSAKKSEPSVKTKATVAKKGDKKGKMAQQGMPLRMLLECKENSLLLGEFRNAVLLLKKMMTKVPHLRQLYPFRNEDDRRIVFRDYTGEVVKMNNTWVVLVRCVLNIHSLEPLPCSLHVWAPINDLVMHLIDNDTIENVPLGYVENSVTYLTKNQEGYTVIVYGSVNTSSVTWCLRSKGVAEENLLHVCSGQHCVNPHTQLPEQHHLTITGYYLPNRQNIIARCLLEVSTDVTVLLRFHLSNRFAVCSFSIVDNFDSNYIVKTTGIGYILIPILKLKGISSASGVELQESKSIRTTVRTYNVEVRLLNDSWHLNGDQIKAMHFYKENLPDMHFILNGKGEYKNYQFAEKLLEGSDYAFFETVDKPTWSLTVVTDLQQVMPLRVCHDISLFDQLHKLKSEWILEGVDLTKCHQLRQDIQQKLSDNYEADWSEEAVFHLKSKRTDLLAELYARPFNDPLVLGIVENELNVDEVVTTSIPSFMAEAALDKSKSVTKLINKSSIETTWFSQSSQHTLPHSRQSNVSKASGLMGDKLSASLPEDGEINHSLIGFQQKGIHKALEKLRIKNMEYVQHLLKESEQARMDFIDERKAAIEAESKIINKANKKDKNSPDEKKGKKKSLEGAKSKITAKGK